MKFRIREAFFFPLTIVIFLYFSCTPKAPEVIGENQESPTQVEPLIPTDPSIRMGGLANGLKYYIKKNGKPENIAELRLAIKAGSMQEDDDQLGIAHFVEHMAFNGSEHFEKNELVDYLESVGTRFGADLNAYTSFDETVYMLQAKTDEPEQLNKALLILEDWAGGISFDHEEIDKERGVVISEWRTSLSAEQRMQNVYFPIMYKNSRYAKRLPIGDVEIIEKAPYETFKRFYQDWYRPNLMAVSVVGDFDVDQMEKQIVERFGKLQNPASPRERQSHEIPKHPETLISVVSDVEAAFTQVQLMYKHDHVPVRTVRDYRQQMVRSLYNGMLNARLQELSQNADPPFTFSYSGYGRDVGNMDSYTSFAFVAEGGAQRGLEVLLEENKRVLDHGFVQSELDRQKTEMLKSVERRFKERDKTESRSLAMRQLYNFLRGNALPSPEQSLQLYKEWLPTIRLDEINVLAQSWITQENRVVVITGPEKEEVPLPSEDEVLNILQKVDQMSTTAYEDEVLDVPLLGVKLSPVAITEEKKLEPVGVTEIKLANGVQVVLKSTDFKNDEVIFSASSEGGSSLYPDKDYLNARFASSIVNQSGVAQFDRTQLEKLLTGKIAYVSPYIGELYEGMRGGCSPEDMETLFQLIYLYFTNPRKDETALKSFVAKQKSFFKNMMSDPDYYFSREVMKIKYQDHPRRRYPTMEDYDRISLDRALEIYRERFADASDFKFVLVGNFELEKIKPLLSTYLGNLPSKQREESWKDVGANYPPGKINQDFKKGQAPKSLIDIEFHGQDEFNDLEQYQFRCLVELLRIKLREALREDKGGVYFVRVSGGTSKKPVEKYRINIYFNSEPEQVQELIQTAMKEIEKVKTNGAEETDLQKIKELQKQALIKNLKQNRFWLNQISNAYQNQKDPNKISLKELELKMQSLNSEVIKNMANRYIDEQQMIKIVMNPDEQEAN